MLSTYAGATLNMCSAKMNVLLQGKSGVFGFWKELRGNLVVKQLIAHK